MAEEPSLPTSAAFNEELIEARTSKDNESRHVNVKNEPSETNLDANSAENDNTDVLNKLEPAYMTEEGSSSSAVENDWSPDAATVKEELSIDVTVLQPPDILYTLRSCNPETIATELLTALADERPDAHSERPSEKTTGRRRAAAKSRHDHNYFKVLNEDMVADLMGDGNVSEIEDLCTVKNNLVVLNVPILDVINEAPRDTAGLPRGQCMLLFLECCATDYLLKHPFGSLSFAQQKEILSCGRSKPEMTMMQKKKHGCRKFSTSIYDKYEWITGSCKLNKMFCFPCLLFSKCDSTRWNKFGFIDLNNLRSACNNHMHSEEHLKSSMSMSEFGQVRAKQLSFEHAFAQHNLKVDRNRIIMKRLINTVVFLSKQELPFHSLNEAKDPSNRGNFVESLLYLSEFDAVIDSHIESCSDPNPVFPGLSDDIQKNLVSSLATVIRDEIKREVRASNFVSVMIDETPDDCHSKQLTVVFRYVVGTRIRERFLGFADVSEKRDEFSLTDHIYSVLDSYGCSWNKLVGLSYDGALTSDEINDVQTKVLERCPAAFLIPCYAHDLNLVLAKSTENISECKSFFSNLNAVATFFSKSTKRTTLLKSKVQKRLPRICETRWQFDSRIVITIHEDKAEILDTFRNIIENNRNWDSESVFMAESLTNKMQEFEFCLLLRVFAGIFAVTDVLFKIIQSPELNVSFAMQELNKFKIWIANNDFTQFFTNIYRDLTSQYDEPPRKRGCNLDAETSYERLFSKIADNITTHVNLRYSSFDKFRFLELLNKSNFIKFKKSFPEPHVASLDKQYIDFFDKSLLKTELKALYENASLRSHTLVQLFDYFHQPALENVFPQINKLSNLVMTLPCTSLSAECSFPAIKRIHTYLRNTQAQNRHSDLTVISIEKEVMLNLKRKSNFYDLVLKQYLKKNRKIALEYK